MASRAEVSNVNRADLAIADKVLENQLYLLRFSAGEKKKVVAILTQMQKELKVKLMSDLTDFGKARVNKLLKESTEIINTYYTGIQQELDLAGLAKQQVTATSKSIASIGLEASIPSAAVMKVLVSDTLLHGAPLSAWWEKQAEDTIFKFTAQVRQGVAQGETLQEIIRRVAGSERLGISGIMDISRRNASALVHDSIMQIANDAKLATFRENSDVVKGMEQLSTLDSRTSQICIAYSGAQWDLDGNPIGSTTLPFDGGTPRHVNCRSTTVPITKTYRELGIDIDEVKGGTRASDLGQIPADTSFSSFLDRHSKEYQDELLGKGKADLWRSGKITLRDLVSQNGRPLTLAQLSGQ